MEAKGLLVADLMAEERGAVLRNGKEQAEGDGKC